MNGAYKSRLAAEERIAAEVEAYRRERFPGLRLRRSSGSAVYPAWIYAPSRLFLRRLKGLGPV